jgi:hypothetical protein
METKICTRCGIEQLIEEFWHNSSSKDGYYSHCRTCMKAEKKQQYQQYKDAGICPICGSPAVPGRVNCQACLDKSRDYSREWTRRKVESGLCGHCGKNPIEPGEKYCHECEGVRTALVRENKERAVKLLGGKCTMCGLETDRWEVYDFHHPERKASYREGISKLLLGKWDKIAAAASRCVLLCANCHRTLHTHDREGK